MTRAGLLAILLLAAACGCTSAQTSAPSSGKDNSMDTLTTQQAGDRANEHVKNAVDALPIEPSLERQKHLSDSMECIDPTDDGPRGRYEIDRNYELHDIPQERNSELVDALYHYWKNNNYRILADQRSRDDKFISVQHNEDAFRMSVDEDDHGTLSLGASSPCVWPDGTPPPSTDR